jgi:hypothetical protein
MPRAYGAVILNGLAISKLWLGALSGDFTVAAP